MQHFITATNALTARITATDIANEMHCSLNAIAQARLDPGASSYRRPPEGWQAAVARLARKRAAEMIRLADTLEPLKVPTNENLESQANNRS